MRLRYNYATNCSDKFKYILIKKATMYTWVEMRYNDKLFKKIIEN